MRTHVLTVKRGGVGARFMRGLSLIEMMIAIVIGMLLTAGIITLFSNVSGTNKVQDGLARLQESGRFAMRAIDADLAMTSGQYCSNFGGNSTATSNGAVMRSRVPWTFTGTINFPDLAAPLTYATAQGISTRLLVQGYECSSGTCTPAVPANTAPAVGTVAGRRLKGTDVLTLRYLTGSGWPVLNPDCGSPSVGGSMTLDAQAGDDDVTAANLKFEPNDILLFSDCQNPSLFGVNGFAGNVVSLKPLIPGGVGGAPFCKATANRDARVFNFSKQFVTVTYYIRLVASDDPDNPSAVVPALFRRQNGVDSELVRGVERLDFVYGVRDNGGTIRFMDAASVDASADGGAGSCIAPPEGIPNEAGCLWRSVRNIEVHALFATPNNVPISPVDQAFRYTVDASGFQTPSGASSPVTGLAWGNKMRREFVTSTLVRNSN